MAGICVNSVRDSGGACEHLTLTVDLDGETVEVRTGRHDDAWELPLSTDEKRIMLRLLSRWWKGKGEDLANFIGRVLAGEEGTNVKIYDFLGPGGTVTKTNIGTAYVDVMLGANGQRILVDFGGCTQFRPVLTANLVAVGPFQIRIVKDGDSTLLYESPSITQTGERELDPGWQAIPAGFSGLEILRLQGKSATGTDDPVFRRCQLLLK